MSFVPIPLWLEWLYLCSWILTNNQEHEYIKLLSYIFILPQLRLWIVVEQSKIVRTYEGGVGNRTQFLPGSGHIDTAIWMHYMDANKTAGEETGWQLHKNAACNPEQVLAAAPHKTPTVRPPAPYHENYSS